MSVGLKFGATALFLALVCVCFGQQAPAKAAGSSAARQGTRRNHPHKVDRTLSSDEGMAVISAALDAKVRMLSGSDCSHLVHAIYERAGFPYEYVNSYDLYDGAESFQRVWHPQPGDVIVWHGHVGIVVRPSRHVFYSFLRSGPTTDNYESPYWISRGSPRFYRYVRKVSCAGCTSISRNVPQNREEK
jgi:cell wall-associated NlpC family hydrolase